MDYKTYSENSRIATCHFERASDLFKYRNEIEKNNRMFNHYLRMDRQYERNWYGPNNFCSADVTRKALEGDVPLYDSDLKEKIETLDRETKGNINYYTQEVIKTKRRRKRAALGDSLDIHRVYQGHLDKAWEIRQRDKINQKIQLVTLFIDVGGTAMVGASDTLWRAAVAVKLQRDFASARIPTKIISGNCSINALIGSRRPLTTSIVIKQFNEGLSLPRLAAMSHIGFYRTFGFAAKFASPLAIHSTLGRSIPAMGCYLPLNLQREAQEGISKVIYLSQSDSLKRAKENLLSAYKQLEDFRNQTAA